MEDKLEQISLNSLALFHRCIKYHYTASVVGDDTDKLRFKVPFAPDTLQIISTDPRIMFRNNRVIFITADLNSLGYAGASQTVIRDVCSGRRTGRSPSPAQRAMPLDRTLPTRWWPQSCRTRPCGSGMRNLWSPSQAPAQPRSARPEFTRPSLPGSGRR